MVAYTEVDEIGFLRDLAITKPAQLRIYARLILNDERCWDSTVNIDAVKAEAERLLAASEMGG